MTHLGLGQRLSVFAFATAMAIVTPAAIETVAACGGCDPCCDHGGHHHKKKKKKKIKIDVHVQKYINVNTKTESRTISFNRGGGDVFFSGGGGGTYVDGGGSTGFVGPLNVVVETQPARPVKAICTGPKGLEEPAIYSSNERIFYGDGAGEVFRCLEGDSLIATIGQQTDGRSDYTGGFVIECTAGEALRHGEGGRLACAPAEDHGANFTPVKSGTGYSEVLIYKSSRAQVASGKPGGAPTYFDGGVGVY